MGREWLESKKKSIGIFVFAPVPGSKRIFTYVIQSSTDRTVQLTRLAISRRVNNNKVASNES